MRYWLPSHPISVVLPSSPEKEESEKAKKNVISTSVDPIFLNILFTLNASCNCYRRSHFTFVHTFSIEERRLSYLLCAR